MGRLCNLPRLNPNATRLLTVTAEVDRALEAFEQIFNSDPSLAAEVLRLANSAEFGLRARVTNIKFALILLGTERTRSLAVSIVMSRYSRNVPGKVDTRLFWLHSVATAVIAEEMGKSVRAHIPLAYTAGLTHDLGRLGLLLTEGQSYLDSLNRAFLSEDEAERLEKMRFGFTHSEAGAYLAQTWHFPPVLCNCIKTHHEHSQSHDDELARITQAACGMASELGFPELPHCPASVENSTAELRQRVSQSPEELREAIEKRLAMF